MHQFHIPTTAATLSIIVLASGAIAQQNYPTRQAAAAQGQIVNQQPSAGKAVAQPAAARPSTSQPPTTSQQPSAQSQVMQPSPGGQTGGMPVLQQPPFPPLNAQFQEYLDKVLVYWEQKTSKVERYKCDFKRFQFDPAIRSDGHSSYATGVLRFMDPDKGMFRVDELLFYAGADPNQKPVFRKNDRQEHGEYWICDGQYVHIMDRNEKKCTKVELPPHMRGKQIYLSPLPFLFGIKAKEIQDRYWIRPLEPPKGRQNEIWLEAFPKRADDAQNYSRVQIILDASDCTPKGLIVFLPNWRPDAQHRELYEFDKREVNFTILDRVNQLNLFRQEFIPNQPPKDWTIVIEPYQEPEQPQNNPQAQSPAQPRVAQPPSVDPRLIR